MRYKNFLLTMALSFWSIAAFAQPRSFSRNPAKFITEFNQYIATENTKGSDAIMKTFTMKWDSSEFVVQEQRNIINVVNNMLMNDLRIPSFVLFTETMLYAKDSIEEPKYISWSKSLIPAINSGNKTFLTLITASRNLFKDNTIYSSSSKKWYSSDDNYRFIFEGNRVQIAFRDIDLVCQADVDRMVVYGTSGSYFLDTDEWEGSKGRVTWERVGFGKDNIYADIQGRYKVKFAVAELNVDTVLFTNTDFLSNQLYGSLRDRVSSAGNISQENLNKSKFPKFVSFRKDLELGSYLDNTVKFKGGYAMNGAEIVANGSAENPSTLEIYYKKQLRVTAKSEYFSMKEAKITSLASEVEILTDSGRIFHPKLNVNLNLNNKTLVMTRGKEGLERAPFFNNDHQIEIYVDQVVWKLELPQIEFDMAGEDAKAIIESADFYKEVRYDKIPRGMLKYHPLSKMRDFVIRHRLREFTFTEYAAWMGSKPMYLKAQIVELADLGYIFFNPATDMIKVRKKLDHAVLSHMKLADYDVIRFSSVISARSNAFLNLINNTFVLEGVRAFRFSDSQSVYAFPHEQKVILKNKRRMEFGGKLTAGKFDFYAKRFDFDYFDFDISSDKIDEMVIFTEDLSNRNRLVAVKSVLRDINGTLEIDKSNNKSGLENYPEYPRFTSKKGAIISYDKKSIHGGVYDKERFRFEVDPFTIENLDNFTTAELNFPGTFVSAGIIPEFRYQAKIMDDYSLGFEKTSPVGGYPMYGGLGQGEIDVKLSESGFTAKGNIDYQGAKITSEDILLTPDYTTAVAESYTVNENDRYPNVFASDVLTKWVPHNDSMYINTNDHTVKVLRDNQEFKGNLVQTSKEIAGNGVLTWENATLTSKDMKYKPNVVDALESQIQIGAISDDKIAFASYNVKSHVDFTTRIGEFKANEVGKLTDFPFNAYASSMDEYTWDMDAQTIELDKGPRLADTESYFVSKKYEQEGLRFQSTNALFDMKLGIIYAEEVPYIDVADSRIFPHKGKVEIHEDADMQRLKKSKMLASRSEKHHELFDGDIKIAGRYALSGAASYKYKDKHNTGQIVRYSEMRVKGRGDTTIIAKGSISDSAQFKVSPKIAYKGNIELHSNEEDILFHGYVKPLHSFEQYPSAWFRYRQQPDPQNVIIPSTEILNEDRRKMYAAVSVANDSIHVYPSMFNFKRSYADIELTSDTGVFFYDEDKKTFYVGDSMKLLEGARRGSYLSYNDQTGVIYSEGKLNFGMDKDEHFNGIMAGNLEKNPQDTTFSIHSLLALNIRLPEECYDRMIYVLNESDGNDVADNDNTMVDKAVAEYLDDKKYNKAMEMVSANGEIYPQGELDRNILISQMNLEYVPYKKQFIGKDPIHLATINGKQINKVIESKIAVTKRRSSTRYTMYFEASKYDWFYIDYYMGSITVASTDKEFNDIIKDKGPKMNDGRFRIRTASPRTVALFLDKLER
ncbi:MAG: hypothetical protein ACPGTP_01760 [Bacteroidia bacterium]